MKQNNWKNNPTTSVIIVTFNSSNTIGTCIDSIIKYSPSSEILVADNNSSDDTVKLLEKYQDRVRLIQLQSNLGFAKANNIASLSAHSDCLVFLNPDTQLLQKGSFEKLRGILDSNDNLGIVGPLLKTRDDSVQKTVRNLPTVEKAFREYILGVKGAYDFYIPKCEDICIVESVVGACMVIKREVFENVGKFDEDYFLYFEDLSLCRKIQQEGLKVGFVPKVKITHLEGASGDTMNTQNLLHQSARKYHGSSAYFLIQFCIRLGRYIHNE